MVTANHWSKPFKIFHIFLHGYDSAVQYEVDFLLQIKNRTKSYFFIAYKLE